MPIDEMNNIALEVLTFFKTMVFESLGNEKLTGTCGFACQFASSLIPKFYGFQVAIRGGDGLNDGGYIDPEGNKHGHYWLEVYTPDQAYIFDITVSQFGQDLPMVLPLEGNKHYINGCQNRVDEHMKELMSGI